MNPNALKEVPLDRLVAELRRRDVRVEPDLTLINTKKLLEETVKRFSCSIFLGERVGTPEASLVTAGNGPVNHQKGLADLVAVLITQKQMQSISAEYPPPDPPAFDLD